MQINNPYRKIDIEPTVDASDHTPLAREYVKSLLDKEKLAQETHPHGAPTDEQSEYKPQVKPEKEIEPTNIFPVKLAKKDLLITQEGWSTLVAQLFLEIFNAEKSLFDISEQITQTLAKQGIDANIADIREVIERTQERMLKVMVAKTLAQAQGLHHEWDKILERELDLIYPRRSLTLSPESPNKA